MIAEVVNMDKETVGQILHEQLNVRMAYAKMVTKNLTQEQKDTGKIFALISWNESQNNRMCLKMSSHVTKRGFFNTIQKRRGNRCIGTHPLHRE
jgi:hypothetical protein